MDGLIYLEDGTVYWGKGFGYKGTATGEIVFNTSMTGYQEILTDPSYAGQIINMTYPLIGNYGVNQEENESQKIHARGLVVKVISETPSNYKSTKNLNQWLNEMQVTGVYDVDTRSITRKVRKEGTMKCVISNEEVNLDIIREICEGNTLKQDLMKSVGTKEVVHIEGSSYKVAVWDFGIKSNIIESLKKRNCDITIFPYNAKLQDIKSINPDGLLLSNGPGDPKESVEAINEIRKLILDIPTFGICLGHQLLALAVGGDTYKLQYGHRGSNHGVYDKNSGKAYITSQNHGFAVKAESVILKGMDATHINLNDGTIEGMRHNSLPFFSVQFHPEASPGPHDTAYLFDDFIKLMEDNKTGDRKDNR